jgi:flagellin-like protein
LEGNLKSKKNNFRQDNNAVSAVIGVILMVAITVAIAATVYVYTSQMMGGGTTTPVPTITFYPTESENTLTVIQGDPKINWTQVNMTATDGTNYFYDHQLTGTLNAGDTISFNGHGLSGSITIRFIHTPTNSLIGTYKLNGVTP